MHLAWINGYWKLLAEANLSIYSKFIVLLENQFGMDEHSVPISANISNIKNDITSIFCCFWMLWIKAGIEIEYQNPPYRHFKPLILQLCNVNGKLDIVKAKCWKNTDDDSHCYRAAHHRLLCAIFKWDLSGGKWWTFIIDSIWKWINHSILIAKEFSSLLFRTFLFLINCWKIYYERGIFLWKAFLHIF